MSEKPAAHPAEPGVVLPHPPLPEYYRDEREHRQFLQGIFDSTAPDYDRIEALMAFGTGPWYRRQALQRAGLGPGAEVLDVGFGTGLVAREALKLIAPNGRLVGVDPSPGMLGQSRLQDVELVRGLAEALPREAGSADFLSMGYALRHIGDVPAAFAEFHRVLRPGGRVLVLEITRPESRLGTALLKAYMRAVVPLLARVVTGHRDTARLWRYYWDTIEACIRPEQVMALLREAGFQDVRQHVELGLFSEYTAVKAP